MKISVMEGAERDNKFVTDFLAQTSTLGKAEMVGICGRTAAHQAGL